jgi:AraC-like DNA-binding protein
VSERDPADGPETLDPSSDPAWALRGHEQASVSISALAPFIRLLEEAGPELLERAADGSSALLSRWGISFADVGSDPTARLPYGLVLELLSWFIEVLQDPSAPLRAGAKLQRGDYELLEYLCGSCNTLGDSIVCLGRYYPLLIAAELELVRDGERAEARFRIAPGLPAPDAIHEFGLASNFAMSALHVEPEGVQLPLEICFAHRPPPHASQFESVFFSKVRFGCGYNAIVFPAALLQHPLRGRDPVLHRVLRRLADQELGALHDSNVFPAKVREAIEVELAQGAALEAVAGRLHMSAGALRSRLRQHGTTYSALLDRLRREKAKRALRQTELGVAELAHSLGFAHPPAFHRAFRRWFGVTPSSYREQDVPHPASRFWRRG